MNLTRTNWPLGWTPNADAVNGDPRGLLRMSNLQLDEDGGINLIRGYSPVVTGLSDFVSDIYTRSVDGVEHTWVALGASGLSIRRKIGNGSFTEITSGNERASFGECFGQVLCCAGATKKKDDLTTIRDLGLEDPANAPTVVNDSQITTYLNGGTWAATEGTFTAGFGAGRVDVDPTTLRGVLTTTPALEVLDTVSLAGGPADNPNQDTFHFSVQLADSSAIQKLRFEILLEADFATCKNYYWTEFKAEDDVFRLGIDMSSPLQKKRGEFTREGDDGTLSWKTVKGFRFIFETSSVIYCIAADTRITGGAKGQLNGGYQYAQQSIFDSGKYFGKSKLSPVSDTVYVKNGKVTVTPGAVTDPQVNKIWLYRRSVNDDLDVEAGGLDDWYRVAILELGETYEDTRTDVDVLSENVRANPYLESVKNLSIGFVSIEGVYKERMLYLAYDRLYLSDRLNPDAIDTRYEFRLFSGNTEKNLWIRKVTNDTLVVATTKDFYEITGTLLDLPDGTLDINIRSIGEEYPPLSQEHTSEGGFIFYVAKDGIRMTSGTNSRIVDPGLGELFRNNTRHGIPPVRIMAGNAERYPITVGFNKLWVCLPFVTGPRQLYVFDFVKKTWAERNIDPVMLHITSNGQIWMGLGDPTWGIWQVDSDKQGFDGTGISCFLETIHDDNQQPRNRKDTFTLKIIADTGNQPVSIYLAKDKGAYQFVGTLQSNGLTTSFYNLSGYTLGFRYSIRLVAESGSLLTFRLTEVTVEYEPRPEQLNYLRILPTNLGTVSRKRFTKYAFVVDTLGNNVQFQPYVDNTLISTGHPTTINTVTKLTFIHFFNSDTVGTDIGGILTGGPFEFYGLNLEETVSEKLPTPTTYLVIPANDYGNPNRKRHTSYKFQINTRGQSVRFTPKIDGVLYEPMDFSTTEKRTVEYFFDPALGDVTGIDIGGILDSLTTTPFEFYGTIVPQHLEILPPRLKSLYIPETNFNVAARKRFRTVPFVINTNGEPVRFTPNLDGVNGVSSTHTTTKKQTVHHYFSTDVFITDIAGFLETLNDTAFEFYGWGQIENVETLPVPKKYDQLGPIRFDKIGKLFLMRFRLIQTGSVTTMPYAIYAETDTTHSSYDGVPAYSGEFSVTPNADDIYEVQIPHNINGSVFRIVLGPVADPFHRYECQIKVALSGMETDSRWTPVR